MADQTETVAHPPTVDAAAQPAAGAAGEPTTTTGTTQESGGLPQFQFQHWAGQIGFMLILFAILYILMSRVFGPRIQKVFEERRATIDGALSSARTVQAEAAAQAESAQKALADARSKAQKTALDAKAKAAAEASQRQASLEADLHKKLAAAEARIGASRDQALGQVQGIAAETANAIVEKLTGVAPAGGAVDAALADLKG